MEDPSLFGVTVAPGRLYAVSAMCHAVCRDGILEGCDNVVLSHNLVPFFWPVFSVESLSHLVYLRFQ